MEIENLMEECLEDLAENKIYIGDKKKPAFLVLHPSFKFPERKTGWLLYMCGIGFSKKIFHTKTEIKEAIEKAKKDKKTKFRWT